MKKPEIDIDITDNIIEREVHPSSPSCTRQTKSVDLEIIVDGEQIYKMKNVVVNFTKNDVVVARFDWQGREIKS